MRLHFAKLSDRLPHEGPAIHGPYQDLPTQAMRLIPWIVVASLTLIYFTLEIL